MRFRGTVGSGWIRWAGLWPRVGGVLWIPYGIFEMLQPWVRHGLQRCRGYEVIVNVPLYQAVQACPEAWPCCSRAGAPGYPRPTQAAAGRAGKSWAHPAYIAVLLAVISLGGVLALFDPVFTACRIFGR
jgi:hypothetical protein